MYVHRRIMSAHTSSHPDLDTTDTLMIIFCRSFWPGICWRQQGSRWENHRTQPRKTLPHEGEISTALGVPAATEIKAYCTCMPFKYWSCSEEASSYRFSLNCQWPLPRSSQDHSDQNNAHTQTLSAKITCLWYNYSSRGVTSTPLISLM